MSALERFGYGIRAAGLRAWDGFVADGRWRLAEEPYSQLIIPFPLSGDGFYNPTGEHASLAQT